MKKKSITLISNNYWTLYRFRYDVIRMLVNEGYSVNLIARKDSYHKHFTDKSINKHFLPLEERGKNIFQEIKTFLSIHRLHKKINPEIIFNFTLKPNIYSNISARILNIKTISMITGLGNTFIKPTNILKKIVIILLRISLKETKEVWFTNKFDEEYFREIKIINHQKTYIVPGAGVKIKNESISRKNTNDKYTFLMVSRLLKEKGVSEFIESANYFKNDLSKNFILIGAYLNNKDYISEETLNKSVRSHALQHHSHTDNIDEYFDNADCIIHPSYREGMSTVLLESASLKIPIITTKVPGCIDIILNKDYGFLCEASNTKSLIKQIIEFTNINNKTPELIDLMVNKTYQHVSNKFNREKIIEKFKKTIESY